MNVAISRIALVGLLLASMGTLTACGGADGDDFAPGVNPDPANQDGDAIPDDGDNSGVAGDNPCTGGETTNCDDNCPVDVNDSQSDADNDGVGDVCEDDNPDSDGDGANDIVDNCPNTFQERGQNGDPGEFRDTDNDGMGDICDPDDDNDGIPDDGDNSGAIGDSACDAQNLTNCDDNCQFTANAAQTDTDGNGVGNACDPDDDGDGVPDDGNGDGISGPTSDNLCADGQTEGCDDNCILTANMDQANTDGMGVGDACDADGDTDNDGLADELDNCPAIPNPEQDDADMDNIGDVCDPDADGDGILEDGDGSGTEGDNPCTAGQTGNCDDNCPTVANASQADGDADGIGDACDDFPGAVSCGGFPMLANDPAAGQRSVLTPLRAANGFMQADDTTGLCLSCSVTDSDGDTNPDNIVNANPDDSTRLNTAINVAGSARVTIADSSAPGDGNDFSGNAVIGVALANPEDVLSVSLLRGLDLELLNESGDVVRTFDGGQFLDLDLLTLLGDGGIGVLRFPYNDGQAFDQVRLSFGSVLDALTSLDVYNVCVSGAPAAP